MMKVGFNNLVNTNNVNFCAKPVQTQNYATVPTGTFSPITNDTFVRQNKREIYLKKLEELFPNNELSKIIADMSKELHLDKPVKINFVENDDGIKAGGYTFSTNEITLSLNDLLNNDYKLSGIKNGKKTTLITPSIKSPLFIDEKNGQQFIKNSKNNNNWGFDEIVLERMTPDEQRKFVLHKIYHEMFHAHQHMLMRQTQGIGEKEILKAWTHVKPKNIIEEKQLDVTINNIYEKTYWATQECTEQKIPAKSISGYIAKIWLEAVRNYPPVDSPEYAKNQLERDAYNRSYQYIVRKYGEY